MRIIADTNIWYYLGDNADLFNEVKDEPICPTYVSILELSKSDNILNNEDYSRKAIRKLFDFQKNGIFEPPIIYLAQLHNEFVFDPMSEIGDMLGFTTKFANGYSIDESKKGEFKKTIDSIRGNLNSGADFFNEEADKIRAKIFDKKSHKKIDTTQITGAFLNFMVESATKNNYSLEGFDLNRIELLLKTLDHFFKTIETSSMKIKDNDWYDFLILTYVQPGDKYWTNDKKWLKLITDAGCEDYLYRK